MLLFSFRASNQKGKGAFISQFAYITLVLTAPVLLPIAIASLPLVFAIVIFKELLVPPIKAVKLIISSSVKSLERLSRDYFKSFRFFSKGIKSFYSLLKSKSIFSNNLYVDSEEQRNNQYNLKYCLNISTKKISSNIKEAKNFLCWSYYNGLGVARDFFDETQHKPEIIQNKNKIN